MAIGVSVANAILLVTFAEQRRREGQEAGAAAIRGVESRLRPILMTSFAMIAGMIPMALGIGEGSEQTAPLGRAVIGGLAASTIAVLIVLPLVFGTAQRKASRASASLHPEDLNDPTYLRRPMELPLFKYHPDPLATDSIVKRQAKCDCCGEIRDYIYDGLPYNEELEGDVTICPWRISDGQAHEKLGLEFNDPRTVGGYDWALRKTVPTEIKEEVAYRTPGFCSWQQEKWLVHCNDACVFLGPAGKQEIEAIGSQELIDSLQEDIQMDEEEFGRYFKALDKEGPPTAYKKAKESPPLPAGG